MSTPLTTQPSDGYKGQRNPSGRPAAMSTPTPGLSPWVGFFLCGVARVEFREIWLVDFEFQAPPGERPRPLCVVAREYHSGRLVRHWLDGEAAGACPYPLGADALLVAYYSSAEWGCHLALGWPLPARVLDLFAEFRNST